MPKEINGLTSITVVGGAAKSLQGRRFDMNTQVMRTLLAAASMLLCSGPVLKANDVWLTEVERRLAALETQSAGQQGVQTAAHLSKCGGQCAGGSCASGGCGCQSCAECGPCSDAYCGKYYGEVQMLFIRPHVSEDWVGKLSESHGFSQRYVVGYEDCCGLGGRVRYWNYNDHVPVLDPSCIDFDMGVLDLEITNRFCFRSTELVVAGGFRYASWGMTDATQYEVDLDAYGLTMAADFSTLIACYGCSQWSFVYGGRLSILGGSWEGDNYIIDTIVTPEVRDDNLLVHELHVGVEYRYHYCHYDLFVRATYEMQNWHSDVLSEPEIGTGIAPLSIGSTDSIGFIGPGLHLGVRF
jgi:hypothetical protein